MKKHLLMILTFVASTPALALITDGFEQEYKFLCAIEPSIDRRGGTINKYLKDVNHADYKRMEREDPTLLDSIAYQRCMADVIRRDEYVAIRRDEYVAEARRKAIEKEAWRRSMKQKYSAD